MKILLYERRRKYYRIEPNFIPVHWKKFGSILEYFLQISFSENLSFQPVMYLKLMK